MINLIECPRDAMQGIKEFIPTEKKARYINQLLKAGFHTIDFGSFVSPKAIPQMRDTADVLSRLDLSDTATKLLAIVANKRGADDASKFEEIDYLGYPFSISETFQLRNTNATIAQSLDRVKAMQDICLRHHKELVVYISMGFGNPYGDPWDADIVQHWTEELASIGVGIISLSDTIGCSTPDTISYLFSNLIPQFPNVTFGAHLHTEPHNWKEKVEAAYLNGCHRFDGAIKGLGGCPMAKDDLTGNMPTENVVMYFRNREVETGVDPDEFLTAVQLSYETFPEEHPAV
jgi:hydroxymethylglutaryl-CoA lyase